MGPPSRENLSCFFLTSLLSYRDKLELEQGQPIQYDAGELQNLVNIILFFFYKNKLADTLCDLDPVYVCFIKYFTAIANSSILLQDGDIFNFNLILSSPPA